MKHVLPYADGDRLDATKVTLFLFMFRALLFLHTRNAQTRTRTSRETSRTLNAPGTDRSISLMCPTCVLSKGLFVSIRLCYSYMHCKYGCIYGFRFGKIQELNQLYLIYIIKFYFYSFVCTIEIVQLRQTLETFCFADSLIILIDSGISRTQRTNHFSRKIVCGWQRGGWGLRC